MLCMLVCWSEGSICGTMLCRLVKYLHPTDLIPSGSRNHSYPYPSAVEIATCVQIDESRHKLLIMISCTHA